MSLSNRHGTPIDPVPFLVVSGLSCMLVLSFGPLYGRAFGLSMPVSVAVSVLLSVGLVGAAFYRQVWDATPIGEAPIELRFERLLYGALAFGVIVVAVTLPIYL